MNEAEAAIHDAVAGQLRQRLKFQYKDIKLNRYGEKKHEYGGFYPDLILSEQGMVLAVVEVESESTLDPSRIEEWKKILSTGVRLILMVPKGMKSKLTGLLWDSGIADKISMGYYEINITMP